MRVKKKVGVHTSQVIAIITIQGKRKNLLLVFSNLIRGIPYEVAWTTTSVLLLSHKRPDTCEATCVATNEQNMMNVIFFHSREFVKKTVVHTSSQRPSTPTDNIELKLSCQSFKTFVGNCNFNRVVLRQWFLSELMTSQPQWLKNVDCEKKIASVASRLRPGRRLVDRRGVLSRYSHVQTD